MFEAANAITADYRPYLAERLAVPRPASAEAAAVAAAHRVLVTYFPGSSASLDAARAASLAAIADGAGETNGVAVGEAAAAAMIALRAADGATPPAFYQPASSDPGQWQLTPACPPAGGILAHWGNLLPFGIKDSAQFQPAPPPPLASRRYARDLNEVKELGSRTGTQRSAHQTTLARFYAAALAVATWNPVASQISETRALGLSANARLFALLNMAISDALVAVMATKYEYAFWRPETAIRHADVDGNRDTEADPAWEPLLAAPCFPSYGSAHAAGSHAARRVLEAVFGDEAIEVTLSHPAVPGVVLTYHGLDEIADDIDAARIYGGIHFRFDQRAGGSQGEKIGRWIVHHLLREAGGR
jgi:hypothetical protein